MLQLLIDVQVNYKSFPKINYSHKKKCLEFPKKKNTNYPQ
jgi:hypothetical protein